MILLSFIALIGHYDDQGDNSTFNGILCHVKEKVSLSCPNNKWVGNGTASDLICDGMEYHDRFPSYDKPGVWIDFRLNGFLVHPHTFRLKGRTADNKHNMLNWSIYGILPNSKEQIPLIHSNYSIQANETYSIEIDENNDNDKLLYSGFRIINHDLDTYHTHPNSNNCSHICLTSFDVFGWLYLSFQTNEKVTVHINLIFLSIFMIT